LDGQQREKTLAWARETLINDGIEKDRPDVIYYCLAVIDILGNTDTQVIKRVDSWLSEEIDKLLLTNISHTCDAIHFALKTRQILDKAQEKQEYPDHLNLLADRIQAALEAELSGLRL